MKRIIVVCVVVLAALLAGWIWGRSGKSDLGRTLQEAELRGQLHEARAAVLDARLAIYSVNFGEASRHLEESKGPLGRATERLRSGGRQEDAKRLEGALARIDEAQRLAGQLNQDANSRAGDAAKSIDDVLQAGAPR